MKFCRWLGSLLFWVFFPLAIGAACAGVRLSEARTEAARLRLVHEQAMERLLIVQVHEKDLLKTRLNRWANVEEFWGNVLLLGIGKTGDEVVAAINAWRGDSEKLERLQSTRSPK